ncbi:GDP-L-fucose synthase [Posidoniimonas polymericola]|uniref:GDP-L-fucose synthase n=2 Tax=Posidoniimonas polymericola TaxID=2528002 RepID=A0A5C5YTW0_9BACT|nr:GDP-L-fucose synthase [Posidoniimonas polymericola]
MVGKALVRALENDPSYELVLRNRDELDLTNQQAVADFYAYEKPDQAIIAAARVGGIVANNTYPVEFMLDNTRIALNTIQSAYEAGVGRLLFLGSTCIYPKLAPQPIPEDSLLTSPLEITNEAYALAKITGLKLCQYYRQEYGAMYHSAMPTNLYGPGDNYHPENSHVLPGLLRRFHEAKEEGLEEVVVWGTGTPRREFLHVDDLAAALVHLLQIDGPPNWVNAGTGKDIPIGELAQLIAKVVGYEGKISFDTSRPDGTPRKLTDSSLIQSTGWQAKISLEEGLRSTYQDFLANQQSLRAQ